MRKKLVAGNWKMNGAASAARSLAEALRAACGTEERVDVLVAPPFTALGVVGEVLSGCRIALGAQNMHAKGSGAFTGEISAPMLLEAGCRYVILGHSERRQLFGETDDTVRDKVRAALDAGLLPILCVGETLAERDAGQAGATVSRQLARGIDGLAADQLARITLAYEPVWAIGTGRNATPAQAQEMHAVLRSELSAAGAPAPAIRILYGGSVTAENAADLMKSPDVDGALVGGASLKADSFVKIVDAAAAASAETSRAK